MKALRGWGPYIGSTRAPARVRGLRIRAFVVSAFVHYVLLVYTCLVVAAAIAIYLHFNSQLPVTSTSQQVHSGAAFSMTRAKLSCCLRFPDSPG